MSWRLYVDVGNSAIKFAARREGVWACFVRIAWDEACANEMLDPETFTVARLLNELGSHELQGTECEGIVGCGSSVDAEAVFEALGEALNQPVRVLGKELRAQLKSKYRPPRSLGADRVANAVAAYALHGGPVVVIDAGSCLTTEIVGPDGTFLGGYIAAGMPALMEGILEVAPQLEEALGREELPEDELIGQTTTECLMIGTAIQLNATVQALMSTAREYLQAPEATVVLTGGLCEYLAEGYEDDAVIADPMLTLEGLRLVDGCE